ncbi:hypothetical protein SKAU_G00312110 [Synaphobranchus kaupii]|uniref:Uncharacterized protein n=1 Tax=Synaphobranchus kaupii TaxID=118154 RepID=A0A9Q1ES05_SYNKA|nr:hypothetical protein SKAU_G00312110 [Synaphobranchus kaupii]
MHLSPHTPGTRQHCPSWRYRQSPGQAWLSPAFLAHRPALHWQWLSISKLDGSRCASFCLADLALPCRLGRRRESRRWRGLIGGVVGLAAGSPVITPGV